MIKIDSVTKTFDTVKSLADVSLIVEKGSIFGLIGSNGSGKSTLLRILCGVYKPDSGDIFYDGVPVWENADVKKSIVYLSDDQFFLTNATSADMMRMYRSVYPTFSVEKYKHYMNQFGLDENRRLNTFSKGMQKQVSFILGLSCCTEYLFCDETLDGLDPVMRQTVRHIIASEVAERGMCVVFASHNLKELEDICDHVALLHRGELLFEAGIDDIKRDIHKIQMGVDRSRADEIRESLKQLDTVSVEQRGSLFTIVARGTVPEIDNVILKFKPLFVEYIPLTLEEIFIAEMEERGYEFHESYIG
ncbi:MAG: ABC transporter ATP-binding protein [Clostridia bacterium]|nr:ABC transporter ATP-binding protein [Clostridia bacterium]